MTTMQEAIELTSKRKAIAAEADRIVRERYGDAYEILYYGDEDGYVIAAPADEEEGGDPEQPTAVYVCDACDVEDAEELYNEAIMYARRVDQLVTERGVNWSL